MKRISRGSFILIIILSFVATLCILIKAFCINEWNTVAASLAVITALISTITAQRLFWKQIDDSEPEIIIDFDYSVHNMISIILTNIGDSKAYDVKVVWNNSLLNFKDELISFGNIPSLSNGQKVKVFVNGVREIWKSAKENNNLNASFTGNLEYKLNKDDSKYLKQEFTISLESRRYRIVESDEQEYYLKSITVPDKLDKIIEAIAELNQTLESKNDIK